jgi:tetratricopeptide (TPR) repeat protein
MIYPLSNRRANYAIPLPKLCGNAFIIVSLLLSAAALCRAQRGSGSMTVLTPGSGKNILEGDLKVDESKAGDNKQLSYTIILYLPGGTLVGRTTVGNGQRYRFLDLVDGEYDVAVEVENREITRERVRLYSQPNIGKTDVRHDIELEFRTNGPSNKATKPSTVSLEDLYKRSEGNEKLFTAAQKATNDKKYDQAILSLRQLLDSDAQDFQAWTDLGTNYLLKEAYDDAEKSYLKAIDKRPSFFLANMALGRLYLAQSKIDKAVELLKRAVEIKAQSADANQLLGEAYLQAKKGSLAVGYLNEALRLDPQGKAEIHLRLALLYNGAGMKAKAATEYEEFLKQRPDYKDRKKLEQYIAENKKP